MCAYVSGMHGAVPGCLFSLSLLCVCVPVFVCVLCACVLVYGVLRVNLFLCRLAKKRKEEEADDMDDSDEPHEKIQPPRVVVKRDDSNEQETTEPTAKDTQKNSEQVVHSPDKQDEHADDNKSKE